MLYSAVAELHQQPAAELEPAQIAERALANTCPVCRETMEIFCSMLGTAAGNLALTLGARGGIYIGGGIVPRLGEFFEQSAFRTRFESKGRFQSYMQAIPTWVIHARYPALLGAAQALK
jgi:glucokinase